MDICCQVGALVSERHLNVNNDMSLTAYLPKSCKARWTSSNEFQSGEALDEIVGAEFNSYDEYIEFHGQLRCGAHV